ncbi:MAG: type IV secretory system conjugative DNA transfer family protein [Flavipsychrobacter sp.]|nr:type IV secretory system conjugative DNA transfer family protein [Flavipsychrobacter sp.]
MGNTNFFGEERDTEYKAEFMPAYKLMSPFNYGFCLTGGLRAITKDLSRKNLLVIGASGSGKTATVCIGTIISLTRGKSSMCVLDVSGELHTFTSGYLAKKGYKIYCIDFSDTSDSFNPLLSVKVVTDAQKLGFLLIKNSRIETQSDPYWGASSEMVLAIFIQYLVFYAPKEYCNMANLVMLIDTFASHPKRIAKLIVRTNDEMLIKKFFAMTAVSERTLQSTLATVRAAIKVFATPALQKCTATNSFNFADFRKEKSILYICIPLNDINYYASYSALLFETLFNEIMSKIPSSSDKDIYAICDELVTMRFSSPGVVWSNIRKYKAGCLGIIQDERMLEIAFSPAEAHAIRTNSYCKVYLSGQPLATCKNLEEILGKYTYTSDRGTEKTRSLLNASEIRMLPKNKSIILAGSEPPILATMHPFYNHFLLSMRTKIPPYQRINTIIAQPPLLPIDED